MKYIIGAGFLLLGILAGQTPVVQNLGAVVQTSDTLNTFRLQFNALDEYVRSTTSTLGTFTGLATTTGNIPVATSTSGWSALTVGTNGYILTASSGAPLGVAWASSTNNITTSSAGSAGNFPYWWIANQLNGTSTLRIASSTGVLSFTSGASSSQLWAASTTFTNLDVTNANEYRTKPTTIVIVNPSSTTAGHSSTTLGFAFGATTTISSVQCYSSSVGTTTIQLNTRTLEAPSTAGVNVLSANLACGVLNASTTSFVSGSVSSSRRLHLELISVTNAPSSLTVFINTVFND